MTYLLFFHFVNANIKRKWYKNECILTKTMYIYDCQNLKITDTDCGMPMWSETPLLRWTIFSIQYSSYSNFFCIYETTYISGNLFVWKYSSQTTNHGSQTSQNKAVTLKIMPTTWVKNTVPKIANQHNMERLLANYRNVISKYSRQYWTAISKSLLFILDIVSQTKKSCKNPSI